jgi:hypothetical protein
MLHVHGSVASTLVCLLADCGAWRLSRMANVCMCAEVLVICSPRNVLQSRPAAVDSCPCSLMLCNVVQVSCLSPLCLLIVASASEELGQYRMSNEERLPLSAGSFRICWSGVGPSLVVLPHCSSFASKAHCISVQVWGALDGRRMQPRLWHRFPTPYRARAKMTRLRLWRSAPFNMSCD